MRARRNGDELPFGITQRGQLSAEHAAGVDADRVVEPLRLRHRRVAIDDHRLSAIVLRPSDSAPAGRTRRSRPWSRRTARSRAPGRRRGPGSAPSCPACATTSRPPSRTEWLTQPVEKVATSWRIGRLGRQLRERLGEAMVIWTLRPRSLRDQLVLVVARARQSRARRDHAHHQPQHAGRVRAAVDQVADEDRPGGGSARRAAGPSGRRSRAVPAARSSFVEAAVDVADDVERAGVAAAVGPQRLPADWSPLDRRRANAACARAGNPPLEGAQRPAQLRRAAGARRARRNCGPGAARCARGRPVSGRSSTIATGSTSCSRASATSCARAAAARWWRRPPSAALPPGACRRCSAGRRTRPCVAAWSFSSSATSPRQKSRRNHLGRQEVRAREGRSCPSR